MLELGQPMHAFDKAELVGSIQVKMASKGQQITLLDGKEVKLDESFLMIADEQKYLAIAGVMGGLNSGVTESTKDIVFEAAYFNPSTIMGKSRDLGVHTESALRFERGVDFNLQHKAIHRATELLLEICGGEVGEIVEVVSAGDIPKIGKVTLSKEKVNRVLGFEVANDEITRILCGLEMNVEIDADNWIVQPPSHRFDIEIAEDLIEEIVRVIGYDKMPSKPLSGESSIINLAESKVSANSIKSQLNNSGYYEAINYSFVSEKQLQQCGMLSEQISLANPLTEEFAVMRTSLLPGMLSTVKYNLRRQNDDLKFYETGNVFSQQENIVESDKILAVRTGKRHLESWNASKNSIDFFDMKGDLEKLVCGTKKSLKLEVSEHDFLHPGRQAHVLLDDKTIGWIGQIHPEVCRLIGIKKDVYAFELFIKDIQETTLPVFQDISKFPSVRRDIAMLIDSSVSYQQLADIVIAETGEYLLDIIVFDEYKDDTNDNARRSLALGIVLQQKNATFEDKDVDKLLSKVVSSITSNLNAELRGG
jgi:phenylalanyl-tRNA synthetase beta chain